MKRPLLPHVPALALACLAPGAHAQDCPGQWADGFDLRGADGAVYTMTVFDDGSGPAVYAAGPFDGIGTAGTSGVAKWDGTAWQPVGQGLGGWVTSLTVFDDGNGPALYAGGNIWTDPNTEVLNFAKFDGSVWAPAGGGVDGAVFALTSFDPDGVGPAKASLYVGGQFTKVGDTAATNIARWDGQAWSTLGIGTNAVVRAMEVFDDDDAGPKPAVLYVGGSFTKAGAVSVGCLARWSGTNWSAPVGGGIGGGGNTCINTLRALGGRTGLPRYLYIGGGFETLGGIAAANVGRWDGIAWSPLGAGTDGPVDCIEEYDPDGSGEQQESIYVGGFFKKGGGIASLGIARWSPAGQGSWSALGSGVQGYVDALLAFDTDGDGIPTLHVGGNFLRAGVVVTHSFARWNGAQWSGAGGQNGIIKSVGALAEFDDHTGDGPALFAGGDFFSAGNSVVLGIAKFSGGSWQPVGGGLTEPWDWWVGNGPEVSALTVFDDGITGKCLYAAGGFSAAGGVPAENIARWNGSQWSSLAGGLNHLALAAVVFDDGSGPALYAAGDFVSANGVPCNRVARWDGSAWSALGQGLNDRVWTLARYDPDGPGPKPANLYAGGEFIKSGNTSARRIARWDGSAWQPLGLGADSSVTALNVYDADGAGPSKPLLFVGGAYKHVGAIEAAGIASWNGSNWIGVADGGLDGGDHPNILSMTVRDDDGQGPAGPALYIAGQFTGIAGIPANSIARWDGHNWSTLGEGMVNTFNTNARITSLCAADSAERPGLYVGGWFSQVGDQASANIALWTCEPAAPCEADLNGDGALDLFDFLAFTNLFNDGDAKADCDQSGGLDLFDFLCFTNDFNAGC